MSSPSSSTASTFAERFAPAFDQRERLVELSFPFPDEGGPPPGCVIPQRVEVTEALSSPFRVTVHALGERHWYYKAKDGTLVHNGRLAHPEQFLGHRARVVVRGEGQERTFDGIVTATRHLGDWPFDTDYDDGFQLVELTIESALALLAYRRTCRIFHDLCPMEVVQDVLQEHRAYNPRVDQSLRELIGAVPAPCPRSYLTQYQESDLDLVQRLLAGAGRHYLLPNDERWDFGHRVELIAPESRLGREPDLTLCGDGNTVFGLPLRHWYGHRALGIARTRLNSPDYKGWPRQADVNGHHLHAFGGAAGAWGEYLPLPPNARLDATQPQHRWAPPLHDDALARQMARDAAADRYEGETIAPLPLGGVVRVRALQPHRHSPRKPGSSRQRWDEYDYVVVGQTLIAHAPLHRDLHQRLAADLSAIDRRAGLDVFGRKGVDGPRLRALFHATPIDQPLAPDPLGHPRKAPGALTGRVIGDLRDDHTMVCTDALGRIGVKLDWQQPADHPLNGHSRHVGEGEPLTWLRYVQPGASDGFGFQYLPRVGDEVLVLFLSDDPDRPVAVGSLYSPRHVPPHFGGVPGLPENAALTGLRTREHRGAGHNEMCMDDSAGEVGLRLASSTGDSVLNLGHIATPRDKGKATHRGTGAELRTEGAAALRAAQGLLLTTFAADKDAPHLAHSELDELVRRCQDLLGTLATAVEKAGGHRPSSKGHTLAQRALEGWPGSGVTSAAHSTPAALALAAAKDVVVATPESQLLYAGKHVDVAADGALHLGCGERAHVNAGQGVTVHACDGGIDLRAAHGPVRVHAPQGEMRLDAREAITVTSHDNEVILSGRTITLIGGDGSYIRLGEGIQVGSPGDCDLFATFVRHDHPRSLARTAQTANPEGARQRARFTYPDVDPKAVVAASAWTYTVRHGDGSEQKAEADDGGLSAWIDTDTVATARIRADAPNVDEPSAEGDAGGAA